MVIRLRAGVRQIVVVFPAGTTEFSFLQNLPTGSGDYKTSYTKGTEDSLTGRNTASV